MLWREECFCSVLFYENLFSEHIIVPQNDKSRRQNKGGDLCFFIKVLPFCFSSHLLPDAKTEGRRAGLEEEDTSSPAPSSLFERWLMKTPWQVARQVPAILQPCIHCEESRVVPRKSHCSLGVASWKTFKPSTGGYESE